MMNIQGTLNKIEESVIASRHYFIDEETEHELNSLLISNERIDSELTDRIQTQSKEINISRSDESDDQQETEQKCDFQSTIINQKSKEDGQKNQQQIAKDIAFKRFHKQAINDQAYSILFHTVKFLICFVVLYFRSESCESNELVTWLEVIKFIEQMTILYTISMILYFQSKRETLKRFYQEVLIQNIDESQILNINQYFEEHIQQVKSHLIKTFKLYRILHFLFKKLSSFLQQVLLIAGNCIYIKFEQTECDINIQWGVFLMLLIGYVFQSAFLACFLMTIASMIVWIPSFTCYLIYTTCKYFATRQKIKKATKNIKKITSKDLKSIESTECMICLENYRKKDEIHILPCNSKHHFHSKCIRQWFDQHLNCPICRKNI